jgi:hypothetical protein
MTPMRLTIVALLLLLPVSGSAQQVAAEHGTFLSKACGFQVKLPVDWKIRPSRSKKCAFTVIAPNRADGDIEVIVRQGTLDDNELGFTKKEDGKWILEGEGSAEAVQIESASWVGLQGTVGSRIYEKGFYRGFGDQTRALLFDRKHRIAEVSCFSGEKVVPEVVKGFEFLTEAPH